MQCPDCQRLRHIGPCQEPIAALFVETGGSYFNLPGVDPWDEDRDARLYRGPYPVICHSPCQRWGKMYFGQPLAVSKGAEKKLLGDDGGCFAHALWCVRTFGGLLEHPWESKAWPWFGLTVPPRTGGWIKAYNFGGMTCCVEQKTYGHHARKPTMLYSAGCDLPELAWGETAPVYDQNLIAKKGIDYVKKLGEVGTKGGGKDSHWRIYTPPAFRDILISIASTARPAFAVAAE